MNRFAEQLSDRAAVILESQLIGDPFALPLTYLYGRDSFVLQGQSLSTPQPGRIAGSHARNSAAWEPPLLGTCGLLSLNNGRFFDLVGKWRDRGREVFYVAYDGLTRVRSDDYTFSPVGEVALDIPLPETSFDHLPNGIVHYPYALEIYKVEPAWKAGSAIYPFSLDVGRFDYGYLMSGFYAREGSGGGWYRWTGKMAEILLPWSPEGKSLVLSLAVGSQRPAGVETANVALYLNGILLDRFDLGNEFKTQTIVVPPDLIADPQVKMALLRLETNPWIPAEAGLEDVRELGIVVDRIDLSRAP